MEKRTQDGTVSLRGAGGEEGAASRPARVEVVAIGDELLLGEIVDTNTGWLARRVTEIGARLVQAAVVGDDVAVIQKAVQAGLERTGTVLCTGGLGPTRDDVTRRAIANLLGREVAVDPAILEGIRRRFRRRGREMPRSNRSQAEVPAGAAVLRNPVGTAPGLAIEAGSGRLVILLPGVPREMHAIFDRHVRRLLVDRWGLGGRVIRHRILRTTGMPESELADRVDDIVDRLDGLTLAFLPSVRGVDLRITSWGELPAEDVEALLDDAERRLRERLDGFVYGRDGEDLVEAVARELAGRGRTLAVAESCTGGLIAKRLTDRPGASAFLVAGLVAYADAAKEALLGVRSSTLRERGAVSLETAREMAVGAKETVGADAGVAVTGIAGPGGGTEKKPVGTVCFAVAVDDRVEARRERFPGGRREVRERSAQAALALLWTLLREGERPWS